MAWNYRFAHIQNREFLERLGIGMSRKNMQGDCDSCAFYAYDEDYETYVCDARMDEDDYVRLMSDSHFSCPYYQSGDEYRIVRKQM